mmetsp:Transcript_23216/g.53421  ORF Transcript_23216/g.53421 Transcript_23216/m.53421 type:complete len:248 (+) Transcript_23216:1157-1900(+)
MWGSWLEMMTTVAFAAMEKSLWILPACLAAAQRDKTCQLLLPLQAARDQSTERWRPVPQRAAKEPPCQCHLLSGLGTQGLSQQTWQSRLRSAFSGHESHLLERKADLRRETQAGHHEIGLCLFPVSRVCRFRGSWGAPILSLEVGHWQTMVVCLLQNLESMGDPLHPLCLLLLHEQQLPLRRPSALDLNLTVQPQQAAGQPVWMAQSDVAAARLTVQGRQNPPSRRDEPSLGCWASWLSALLPAAWC